jgi:hypothetical protein
MPLDAEDADRLDAVTTFPLVSPYTNGALLKPWTMEAEKYRVGVVHEFPEPDAGEARADQPPHLIREVAAEAELRVLRFYLAGTEMNWAVFLRDACDDSTWTAQGEGYDRVVQREARAAKEA